MKFFVMEMPLDKDGLITLREADTVKTLWEVWDNDLKTVATFDSQGEAQGFADRENALNGVFE